MSDISSYSYNNQLWEFSDIKNAIRCYMAYAEDCGLSGSELVYGHCYYSAFVHHTLWLFVSTRHFYIYSYAGHRNMGVVMFMGNFCVLCWEWCESGEQRKLDCPGNIIGFDVL